MTPALEAVPDGGDRSPLFWCWYDALRSVVVRHPNGISRPVLRLVDGGVVPHLYVGLDVTTDTSDPTKTFRDFAISTVELLVWPGEQIARAWFAAAWVGYLQHEALELVTVGDLKTKCLDPHAEPYTTNPANRGLRVGFPVHLTWDALVDTLALVMGHDEAVKMVYPPMRPVVP